MSSPASALKLENVLYEKKGAIAYVTINRPKVLNALNAKTISELRSAFEDARDDSEVRGVVFTGAGDKSFAAGVDIGEMANDTPLTAEAKTRSGQALTDLIENLGKPVIAAVNGFALGGGCELSMASTVRIAAETARFGQPEVKIGVMPGYGGTRSEEHTSELQSRLHLVCRLLLEKKKNTRQPELVARTTRAFEYFFSCGRAVSMLIAVCSHRQRAATWIRLPLLMSSSEACRYRV